MDSAYISTDGRFLYRRTRAVGPSTRSMLFVLAYTRDSEDPDLAARAERIAAAYDCGIIHFVGLMARRCPNTLPWGDNVGGPENDVEIARVALQASFVVAAWGHIVEPLPRVTQVVAYTLRHVKLWCLRERVAEPPEGYAGDLAVCHAYFPKPSLRPYRGGACIEP